MLNLFNTILSVMIKSGFLIGILMLIAFLIQLVVEHYQQKVGGADFLDRIREYFEEKEDIEQSRKNLQEEKKEIEKEKKRNESEEKKLIDKSNSLDESHDEWETYINEEQQELDYYLDFWSKMTTENEYQNNVDSMQHMKEVITASSSKRKFLKFLKEELPKANSTVVVQEVYEELEQLFEGTNYQKYVLEAYQDRASRSNPVLVAFELYSCYNVKNAA